MIGISIRSFGRAIPDGTPNVDELSQQIGAFFLSQNKSRYLRQVTPDEVPWIESDAAKARKGKRDGGTLFDTGSMFHAMHLEETISGRTRINIPDDTIPYAKYHHFGRPPQIERTVLGISKSDKRTAVKMAEGFYLQFIRGQ